MKIFIAVVAVLAVTTYASAAAIDVVSDSEYLTQLEDVDADGGIDTSPDEPIIRERRLTCDLFSFSSKVATPNHAACAAKCIGQGKKGGSCQGTNCVCRGDKWIG